MNGDFDRRLVLNRLQSLYIVRSNFDHFFDHFQKDYKNFNVKLHNQN